jgi:hypothetical protein
LRRRVRGCFHCFQNRSEAEIASHRLSEGRAQPGKYNLTRRLIHCDRASTLDVPNQVATASAAATEPAC